MDRLAGLPEKALNVRSRTIRRWIGALRRWPVHPQWLLSVSREQRELQSALAPLRGRVLDIGCADKHVAARLPEGCSYIGLDYPDTAIAMYRTRPDVFADAGHMPFPDGCMQAVILKDVLEHVCGPQRALAEIGRVLCDGGKLVLWMPFMYPIHDAPHDFQRFTEHGLRAYLAGHGLHVVELKPILKPVATASLMCCLAFADMAETILLRRRWLLPLLPVLALLVLLTNLAGKIWSWLPASNFMPAFYRVLAVREPRPQQGAA